MLLSSHKGPPQKHYCLVGQKGIRHTVSMHYPWSIPGVSMEYPWSIPGLVMKETYIREEQNTPEIGLSRLLLCSHPLKIKGTCQEGWNALNIHQL
jgi:hypothetical protein